MDIDLWWTLGGWLFFQSDHFCMATLKNSEFSTFKSQSFLYFITLFFIFLILVHSSSDPMSFKNSNNPSSSTTMKLHPRKIPRNHHKPSSSKTHREFEAGAHEVPSGPNPISNR
ncbi:hypothetical protein A4A49_38470 [Nicotiana attenuata]|uniref:Uncharacterized protein n=1 Tax=Nicotiana attenuata TaxID=49451 RepID=A0A1J6KMB3_NICAT|nr:hypothetical protein A4A49_38470 [Nicotiana attenuata]